MMDHAGCIMQWCSTTNITHENFHLLGITHNTQCNTWTAFCNGYHTSDITVTAPSNVLPNNIWLWQSILTGNQTKLTWGTSHKLNHKTTLWNKYLKLESTGYSALPSPPRLMRHCGMQSCLGIRAWQTHIHANTWTPTTTILSPLTKQCCEGKKTFLYNIK